MVILISLGDTGMKEDTSVKLADIVMPDREIDTFMTEVEKPDKPEEQPEDIAQPELDLAPLQELMFRLQNQILILKLADPSLEMVNISHCLKWFQYIQEEHKSVELWVMH